MTHFGSSYSTPVCQRSHSRPPAFFFFNDTATTEIYTLSLHDALPIFRRRDYARRARRDAAGLDEGRELARANEEALAELHRWEPARVGEAAGRARASPRGSGGPTAGLPSHRELVCRLLPEKKKKPAAS